MRAAAVGAIVILGITPDSPETGHSYIRRTGETGQSGEHTVAQFAEKPDLETAVSNRP